MAGTTLVAEKRKIISSKILQCVHIFPEILGHQVPEDAWRSTTRPIGLSSVEGPL